MQIILTQAEIEEAVHDVMLQRISIHEDHTTSVMITTTEDGESIAVIDIGTAEDTNTGSVSEKKTRRKRRTRAEIEADEAAAKAITPEPEPQAKDSKVPWTEDPTAAVAENKPESSDEIVTEDKTEEKPAATSAPAAGGIFPNAMSSAPANQEAEKPPVNGAAKSLFANLTKPVHDAPRD